MLTKYASDRYYLLKYALANTLVLAALVILLVRFNPLALPTPAVWLVLLLPVLLPRAGLILATALVAGVVVTMHSGLLHAAQFLLIPVGICFGISNVQLIHACAHRSFRPIWINRPLGQFLSLQLFFSFLEFTVTHLEHHRHSDDERLDPHPNREGTFSAYFRGMEASRKNRFKEMHFDRWRLTPTSVLVWNGYQAALWVRLYLRAALVLLGLGPVAFCLFFFPSVVANQLTFAHMNFFTHRKNADGSTDILNIHEGWDFRILNFLMFDAYFHGNHHRAPSLFRPSKYVPKQ